MKNTFMFFVVLLLVTVNHFQVVANDHSTLVDKVYIKSGLAEQIPAYQEQVNIMMKAYESQLSEKMMAVFVEELNKVFSPIIFEARIKQYLKSDLDAETLSHILKWCESALGKRVVEVEVMSSSAEETRKFIEFSQQADLSKVPQNRLDLLNRLDNATESTETTTDAGIYFGATIAEVWNDMNPETKPYSRNQILQFIKGQRTQMLEVTRERILLTFLYTYRELTDEDLLKYVEFTEMTMTKKFNKAVSKAILRSVYIKSDLT